MSDKRFIETHIKRDLALDSIERAIRNALLKAKPQTSAQRQAVYQSVWAAHERALAGNANLTNEIKNSQREKLKTTILYIENEIRSETTPVEAPAAHPEREDLHSPARVHTPTSSVTGLDAVPEGFSANTNSSASNADVLYPANDEPIIATDKAQENKRKHASNNAKAPYWRRAIVPISFLLAALIIAYSFYNSFGQSMSRNSSANNGSQYAPLLEGEQDTGQNWLTIFDPSEASGISTNGRVIAELKNEGNSRFLRVISPGPTDTVRFAIGEGILQQLVGKRATFNIVTRGDTLDKAQMTVTCDFGNLGDCGRRRFDIGVEAADYLLDVDFTDPKQTRSPGWIEIASDLSGQGAAIEILSIRVLAE